MKHSKLARLLASSNGPTERATEELKAALRSFVDLKRRAESIGQQMDELFDRVALAEAEVERLIMSRPDVARACRGDVEAAMDELTADGVDESAVAAGSG